MWKIDGEAGGDEDDNSEHDELDNKNDDSDNHICSSENIARMETQLLQRNHRCYLSLFSLFHGRSVVRSFGLFFFNFVVSSI